MVTITSRRNPLVASFRDVARGDPGGLLLLDGPHLVHDAAEAGIKILHAIVAEEAADRPDLRPLVDRMTAAGVDVALATSLVMDAVSPVRSPSDIVALAERPPLRGPHIYEVPGVVVIASGVQDPGNLGAIVRVAEAAGAAGVVSAGNSANPFGWRALRGSMASALRLPIVVERDTEKAVGDARRHGWRVIATVPRGGTTYVDANLHRPVAILIGGEGGGLSADAIDAADERVSIPMETGVDSLNAAVATAILVYEARRQRTL